MNRPQCPNCKSKHIDTTLNYNRINPEANNCRCLDCGCEFNHSAKREVSNDSK